MDRMNINRRRGFTLVELLVVVSVIALLISILLPAVGQTRRQARILLCTSNIKQHGMGMQNFASANDDELPNAPKSPGSQFAVVQQNMGITGKTALRFAMPGFDTNGFQWGTRGVATLTGVATIPQLNPLSMNEGASMQGMYWIVLSEFMVDGQGLGAMQDIFISPGDPGTKADWKLLRDYVKRTGGSGGNGRFPQLNNVTSKTGQFITQGSYKYVPTAVIDPAIFKQSPRNGEPIDLERWNEYVSKTREGVSSKWDYGGNFNNAGGLEEAQFYQVVKRNRSAAIDYPSDKVMFWLRTAVHDPRYGLWNETGATCPLASADGSARAITPFRDALPSEPKENAGSIFSLGIARNQHERQFFDTYFLFNYGGIKGRDL